MIILNGIHIGEYIIFFTIHTGSKFCITKRNIVGGINFKS